MKIKYKNIMLITTFTLSILNTTAFAVGEDEIIEESRIRSYKCSAQEESTFQERNGGQIEIINIIPPVEESLSENQFTGGGTLEDLEIPSENLFVPANLGKLTVTYLDKEFFITNGTAQFQIQRHNLSKEIRGIREDQLLGFLNAGYLSVGKIDDEYTLKSNLRLRGGGPISGAIAYWVTKTVCYGTAVAGASAVVVATGGAAGAAAGGLAAASTVGATAGASVVGGAIAGAGLAAEAGVVTAAAVTSAGGVAGAVAAVESASLGMGALFTAIPFLP